MATFSSSDISYAEQLKAYTTGSFTKATSGCSSLSKLFARTQNGSKPPQGLNTQASPTCIPTTTTPTIIAASPTLPPVPQNVRQPVKVLPIYGIPPLITASGLSPINKKPLDSMRVLYLRPGRIVVSTNSIFRYSFVEGRGYSTGTETEQGGKIVPSKGSRYSPLTRFTNNVNDLWKELHGSAGAPFPKLDRSDYVKFVVDVEPVIDTFESTYEQNMFADFANALSQKMRQIRQLLPHSTTLAKSWDQGKGLFGTGYSVVQNMVSGTMEWFDQKGSIWSLLTGARVDIPRLWENSSFSGRYTFTTHLYAQRNMPDIYTYVLEPLAILLCLVCPNATSGEGLTYEAPFAVRARVPGVANIPMGAIENITINKDAYTGSGDLFGVSVSITIASLYTTMYGTVNNSTNKSSSSSSQFLNATGSPTITSYLTELSPGSHSRVTDLVVKQGGGGRQNATGAVVSEEDKSRFTLPSGAPPNPVTFGTTASETGPTQAQIEQFNAKANQAGKLISTSRTNPFAQGF
jgi:hypothetical protein